jgi:pilus assembly protein CpaB
MRPIVIVLIVLALGTALIAAYLAKVYVASQTTPVQATTTQTGTENVLVAARDLNPGTVLEEGDVRWEPWPKDSIDSRFIVQQAAAPEAPSQPANDNQPEAEKAPQAPQDFVGQIVRRPVMAGEPMSQSMVIKQGDGSVVAANLAPGKRAITISVTPATGVAGLILPNDHVDVAMDSTPRELAGLTGWNDVIARYATETVIKDLRVIAINQKMSHDPKTGVGENGSLVTLEVTPAQAEKLLVAKQIGSLTLILRSMVKGPNDNLQQTFTMDVRASRTLSSLIALGLNEDESDMPPDAAAAMVQAKERAKNRTQVTINRGGTVAIQKFGN